jgi:hypothetical protein
MELHLFGVTDKRQLWHSIGDGAGRWDELGDVDLQTGTVRTDQTDTEGTDRTIVDAAGATDNKGNLHVLVLADDGRLWHTVRVRATGNWSFLKDLTQPQGPAVNIGKVTAVGAATEGMTLFVLAATGDKKLHRAIRKPDGQDVAKGKWERPFEQIKPAQGPTPPPTAPFTVLGSAYFKTP